MTTAELMIGGIVFGFLCVALIDLAWFTWRLGIGPASTPRSLRTSICVLLDQLLLLKENQLLKGDTECRRVIELGTGFGALTYLLGQRYPSTPIVGYELSFSAWLISTLKTYGLRNVCMKRLALSEALNDLETGDILYAYLCPQQMLQLKESIQQRQGQSKIRQNDHSVDLSFILISLTFQLPEWIPVFQQPLGGIYRGIYVYSIKL